MNTRLFILLLLTFCSCAFVNTAPLETENEEETSTDLEKTYIELQDLKRVVRQCPFSGGAGGIPGIPGMGGAGGAPDLNQLISIARTVLNLLDGGGAGGAGGIPGIPGIGGTDPNVDTNVLGRLRGRRGRF